MTEEEVAKLRAWIDAGAPAPADETPEADPRVQLLAEPPAIQPIWRAFSKKDDASHLLWTDDYLAAFAVAADVELATLDRALVRRYPTARVAWIGRG